MKSTQGQTLNLGIGPAAAKPIRTLIVDDEQFARQRLHELCAMEPDIEVIGECAHGKEAASTIEALRPDLVLLDIQMRGTSGFDVLKQLDSSAPLVIFVTAFENYALGAFEFDAVDYLLKPFDAERFGAAIGRARQRLRSGNAALSRQQIAEVVRDELKRTPQSRPRPAQRIVAERDDRLTFIDPQDIDSIEADRNYISIRVGRESFRLRCTMQQAEGMLDPDSFLRIHRCVIINSLRIQDMERWFHGEYVITLKNGQRFTSGRGYRQRIRGYLKNGLGRPGYSA
jgi:two-component system LytT family response regulator